MPFVRPHFVMSLWNEKQRNKYDNKTNEQTYKCSLIICSVSFCDFLPFFLKKLLQWICMAVGLAQVFVVLKTQQTTRAHIVTFHYQCAYITFLHMFVLWCTVLVVVVFFPLILLRGFFVLLKFRLACLLPSF